LGASGGFRICSAPGIGGGRISTVRWWIVDETPRLDPEALVGLGVRSAETFLTAWRRLDDVPAADGARLWLYGVARRVCANQRRGDRRRYELADRLRTELSIARGSLEYTGELADVAAAFRRLADRDRGVLALEGWEGLDPAAIAAVLGCSRNAARIRLHRARRRLTAELAHHQPDAEATAARVVNGAVTWTVNGEAPWKPDLRS
jgi:RNA polymerase sigma factor (sigma-70 family)